MSQRTTSTYPHGDYYPPPNNHDQAFLDAYYSQRANHQRLQDLFADYPAPEPTDFGNIDLPDPNHTHNQSYFTPSSAYPHYPAPLDIYSTPINSYQTAPYPTPSSTQEPFCPATSPAAPVPSPSYLAAHPSTAGPFNHSHQLQVPTNTQRAHTQQPEYHQAETTSTPRQPKQPSGPPWICLSCGDSFSRGDALKRHKKSGACINDPQNTQRYKCSNWQRGCLVTFSRPDGCQRHLNDKKCGFVNLPIIFQLPNG